MHIQVYKDRPDVNSVCHAHPPYATGFAVAGLALDQCVLPEVIIALGNVPLVDYGTPGTDEFYKPVVPLLPDYDAFLLANHGALTVGKDILNAYHKMETLEHFAHITFVANQLGHVTTLPGTEVKKLTDLRTNFGIRTNVGCVTCEDEDSCETTPPQTGNASSELEKQVTEITERIVKQLNLK